MLWMVASLGFAVLAARELMGGSRRVDGGFYWPYFLLVCGLALACAWPPLSTWRFERFLSSRAIVLADGKRADVHCNTLFDTMLSSEQLAAGYASFDTGEIRLQKPWCARLRRYLRNPDAAGGETLWALGLFTHEVMHVRGERNEALTECQAVQRNYRAARLLGVPDATARKNARDYYELLYKARGQVGGMQGDYYSTACAPGGAMDEKLADSSWAQP